MAEESFDSASLDTTRDKHGKPFDNAQGKPFEENLERELYAETESNRRGATKSVWGVKRQEPDQANPWPEQAESIYRSRPLQRYFWVAGGIFLIGLIIFSVSWAYRAIRISGVQLQVIGISRVEPLTPTEYTIEITNHSKFVLPESALEIHLEGGAYFEDAPETADKTITIGRLAPGQKRDLVVSLFFAGMPNQVTQIKTAFVYLSPNRNQQFSVEKNTAVSLSRPTFDLKATLPNQVIIGEPFELRFQARNVSAQPFDFGFEVTPPNNFSLLSYSPPTDRALLWSFSNLEPNANQEIIMAGQFTAQPLSPVFTLTPILTYRQQTIRLHPVAIPIKSLNVPIVLQIEVNPKENLIGLQRDLTYTITWKNESSINLSDVRLSVSFSGPFDPDSLRTNGYLSATEGTLIWDARNAPALQNIAPGDESSVSLTVRTPDDYPGDEANITLGVRASLETASIPPEVQILTRTLTVQAAHFKKLTGHISLTPELRYRNDSFINYGPFPPAPGSPTALTVYLPFKAWGEDFSDISFRTRLPFGVRLINRGDLDPATLTYNQTTGELTYAFSQVAGNTEATIAFQIEITPPASDPRTFTILQPIEWAATGKHSGKSFSGRANDITLQDLLRFSNE